MNQSFNFYKLQIALYSRAPFAPLGLGNMSILYFRGLTHAGYILASLRD